MISDLFWWLLQSQCLKHSQNDDKRWDPHVPTIYFSTCHGTTNPFPPLCIENLAIHSQMHITISITTSSSESLWQETGLVHKQSQHLTISGISNTYPQIPINTISVASVSDFFGMPTSWWIRRIKAAAIEKQQMIHHDTQASHGITRQPSTGFHPSSWVQGTKGRR